MWPQIYYEISLHGIMIKPHPTNYSWKIPLGFTRYLQDPGALWCVFVFFTSLVWLQELVVQE
jgi:hypothetical protein